MQAGPGHARLFGVRGGEGAGGGSGRAKSSLPVSRLDEVSLVLSEKGISLYLKKEEDRKSSEAESSVSSWNYPDLAKAVYRLALLICLFEKNPPLAIVMFPLRGGASILAIWGRSRDRNAGFH